MLEINVKNYPARDARPWTICVATTGVNFPQSCHIGHECSRVGAATTVVATVDAALPATYPAASHISCSLWIPESAPVFYCHVARIPRLVSDTDGIFCRPRDDRRPVDKSRIVLQLQRDKVTLG